jgi:hypothetical protein
VEAGWIIRWFWAKKVSMQLQDGSAAQWSPKEAAEIARRRRVLGGAKILSDEQMLQIRDPAPGLDQPTPTTILTDDEIVQILAMQGFIDPDPSMLPPPLPPPRALAAPEAKVPRGPAADEPLLVAICAANDGAAKALLENGAKVDQRVPRRDGATLLMRAVDLHDPTTPRSTVELAVVDHGKLQACIGHLIAHGADQSLTDNAGRTALHRAFVLQLPEVADLLMEGGAHARHCMDGGGRSCRKCALNAKMRTRKRLGIRAGGSQPRGPPTGKKKNREQQKDRAAAGGGGGGGGGGAQAIGDYLVPDTFEQVLLGLGRIVALYYRSSASYQIH